MKRLSKRIISSVLTGTMLLSLLGGSALAVEPEGAPEEDVRSSQPVMSDVVSIQAYTEESETGMELNQIEIVYEEGTDLSGLNGESYLLEGRGSPDEEFTEIQIQEVTIGEESALLEVGGFTTNLDTSEGAEEGMDLRLRHAWEEEDAALAMSGGDIWLPVMVLKQGEPNDSESLKEEETEEEKDNNLPEGPSNILGEEGDDPGEPVPMDVGEISQDDIESIQAFTKLNFYGQRLYQIEVTFAEGTDMEAAEQLDFKVWDRAFQNGEFEEGSAYIDDVSVRGNTVTLSFDQGPADNKPFGMLCTASWAIAEEFDESGDLDGYEVYAGRSGKPFNYFTRQELDLILAIGTDAEMEDGLSLTDGYGHYTGGGVWEETVNDVYDDYKLAFVEAVDDSYYTAFQGEVPVHYQVPDSYDEDEGMPLVLYVTGNGTSYWEGFDDQGNLQANNLGTNVTYDNATEAWLELDSAIVGSPDVHSQNNKAAGEEVAHAIEWFQENYNITKVILIGNSNGTGICSQTMRDFPELVDVFICNNGWIGDGPNRTIFAETWPEESLQKIAEEGIAIWVIQGETDPLANPINSLKSYQGLIPYYKAAGWSDEWIADNLRISAFKHYKFEEWGVNDHSCVKMSSWYYIDEPYLDVYEGEDPLEVGETYHMEDARNEEVQQFEYVTYAESISDWALNVAGSGDKPTSGEPTPIEETEKADASIGSYQRINGYFTYQISVNDSARAADTREIEVYIPEGARQREYWISMALPSGVDSTEFLEKSGWFDIADETLACLLIMKPENGTWGSAEDELAYVDTAMGTLVSSGAYYSAFTYHYLVGYGDGAPALQLWAAQNPLKMISQVYVDAQADAAYDALLEAAGETQVGKTPQPNHMDFEGYNDKDGNQITQKRTFEAQHYNDIPIPTWFVGDTSESLITYWKDVNDCLTTAVADSDYGQVYWQDKANSDAIATSFSDVKTQVAVQSEAVSDMADPALTENINSFLTYYSGYDNNSVYGHFITQRLPYTNQDTANVLYRDHMWEGTNRTYIVYIPDSVKSSGSPAPLVVTTHGAGQTAMVFLEATDIKEAADKYGFIAVTYDLTGNADYMLDLLELVKADCEAAGVTVDEDRIYGYGQSAGGGATANTLAQDPRTVELFAAFGITSGVQTTAQENGSRLVVPFYAIYGEYDYWPMKLGALEAGEWTGSQGARQCAWTTNTQTYWAQRLLGKTLDELVATATVDSGITEDQIGSQHAPISLIVNPTETANRYKNYIWSDDFGGGEVPIFVWSQCYGRGHNLVPSDLNELWENWFSKWERGSDDHTLLYYENGVGNGTAVEVDQTPDLDNITQMTTDWSQAAQLPLTGWYTKSIDVDGDGDFADDARTVKVYIAPEASIRSYFTVVAVPDNVDTYDFLEENGWIDLADEKGEGLFVLEPNGTWSSADTEKPYVDAAMNFLKSCRNANNQTVFSTFGEHYLVGYGAGAAPLELWAAANPIFVISQVYVDGATAGKTALDAAGAAKYDGTNTSGYDQGVTDYQEFLKLLEQCGLEEIARKDVPVPTWFAGSSYADAGNESVVYWAAANDCTVSGGSGTFYQDRDSAAVQTAYANSQLPDDAEHGISQVKLSGSSGIQAEDIYQFLSIYTRYDNTFAYANSIGYRLDYTSARVAAQQEAKEGAQYKLSDGTEVWGMADVDINGHGTVQVGVIAFSDNSDDGKWDPREYVAYIPDGFEGEELPILIVYPGNSQTDSIFLDSTLWWQVADKEGFVPVMICETYSSPTGVSHADADKFYNSMMTVLAEEIDGVYNGVELDFTRIYGSGQSAGSMTTQGFVRTNPEFYAAAGSTSGIRNSEGVNEFIPTMLIAGQSDLGNLLPDLWGSESLQEWAQYLFDANGLTDADINNWADQEFINKRTNVYTWENEDGIPLVSYGQTLLRPHNCYPGEMPILWDFMEHFSFVKGSDGSLTRYYSPSAFEKNDAVRIDYIPGTVTPDDGDDDDDDDSSSGSSGSRSYAVSASTSSGKGTVSVSPKNASEGTRVTITVTPASGYEVDSVTVTDRDGDNVRVTKQSDTRYTFTMPDSRVEVEVSFVKTGETAQEPDTMVFSDVKAGDWFYDAVLYAYENGLMSGTGAAAFSPNQTLTRAMVAQVLYSMEGAPAGGTSAFTDVAAGTWYANAVNWAAANGVVSGYGDGTFGPNDNITREQMVTILYGFAKSKGYDVSAKASLASFTDASSVSAYAQDAMGWAVSAGLISGMGNSTIAPQGSATRAQFAVMLMQFCEEVAK